MQQLDFFDGFPYMVTRVSPSLYHLSVLPAELHIAEVVRWQALANKMNSCFVYGPDCCIYFDADANETASAT